MVHSLMFLKYIILCLPLALLPSISIFPLSDKFFMPFLIMTCPKNAIFLFLMVCKRVRLMLAIVNTRSFATLSDLLYLYLGYTYETSYILFYLALPFSLVQMTVYFQRLLFFWQTRHAAITNGIEKLANACTNLHALPVEPRSHFAP